MEINVRLSLTKDEVIEIIKQHFEENYNDQSEIEVKISKHGEHLAEVNLPTKKASAVEFVLDQRGDAGEES